MLKWVKRFILLAAVGGAAYLVVRLLEPAPIAVQTELVVRGPLRGVVEAQGATRIKDRFVVAAPTTGHMLRITLRPGDEVQAGQEIAAIEPLISPLLDSRTRAEIEARAAAADAAVVEAEAAVRRAALAADRARREMERAKSLVSSGLITPQALDAAEFEHALRAREVEAASLALETARRTAQAARAPLAEATGTGNPHGVGSRVSVLAPATGRVLRVYQESAGPVQAGTPLLEIGDPAAIEVVVDVLTTDAVATVPGSPVEIHGWGGKEVLRGVVRLVEPLAFPKISPLGVEERRVNVLVDPAGDPATWRALGGGFRVEARIVVWEEAAALRVPVGAVFRKNNGWAVFVVEGGRASLRPIRLGRRGTDGYEVLGGLSEGERVVMYPAGAIADGAEVIEE